VIQTRVVERVSQHEKLERRWSTMAGKGKGKKNKGKGKGKK